MYNLTRFSEFKTLKLSKILLSFVRSIQVPVKITSFVILNCNQYELNFYGNGKILYEVSFNN